MLEYNEIRERRYIILDGEPYEVLSSHVFRKQQRKPVNATKLRNLITGSVVEHSFAVSDKVEEADLTTKQIKYIYTNRGEYWFCEANDPGNRFNISEAQVGERIKFIKTNTVIEALMFQGKIIGIKYPIKVELKVTEAALAVRGNTVQGGTKTVKVETGAEVNVPMFIKEGEAIRINTESGEYAERAGK